MHEPRSEKVPTFQEIVDKMKETDSDDYYQLGKHFGIPAEMVSRIIGGQTIEVEDRFLIYNLFCKMNMMKSVIRLVFGYSFQEINKALSDELLCRINPIYKFSVDPDDRTKRKIIRNCMKEGYTVERIKELTGLSDKEMFMFIESKE